MSATAVTTPPPAPPTTNTIRFTTRLHRLASVSPADFSARWEAHAALAAPWFLFHGVRGYTQMHPTRPDKATQPAPPYDGFVTLYFEPDACSLFEPRRAEGKPGCEGARRYVEEVILVDERRFWDREGKGNVTSGNGAEGAEAEGGGVVAGREIEVIVDGEIVIEVPREVWARWEAYLCGMPT